jgi:archaetidylinositol phosphate synthase
LGESAIYIGLVIGFGDALYQLVGLALLVFSYSISYLRARGEGLGITLAGIGIMERAERMMALFFASLLAYWLGSLVFFYALVVILVLIFVTVVHRFVKVYDALKLGSVSQ